MRLKHSLFLAGVAAIPFLGITPLQAQQVTESAASEERLSDDGIITVTARRQSESLNDVPASVSVLTAENLADSGIATMEQAIAFTPGVTIVSNAAQAGDAQINIRGVNGARDAENNVALVVDGILKTNTAAVTQYQGVMEQFEVLKGPQGAYYGRGATAGAIVLTTKKPSDYLAVSGKVSVATQDSQLGEASISGPLTDDIGAVVYGRYRHTDGFYENTGFDPRTQGKTVDNLREWSIGGRIFAQASDDLQIDAKARYGKLKSASLKFEPVFALPTFAAAFGNPDFFKDVNDHRFTFLRNVPNINNQRTIEASLKFDYEFDSAKLTGWASFSDIDETLTGDATAAGLGRFNGQASCINSVANLFASGATLQSPLILAPTPGDSILGAFSPTTCDGIQVTVRDQRDISAELRLVSTGSSPLQWSLGAYYLHIDRHYGVAVNEDTGGVVLDTLLNLPGSANPTSQLFDDQLLTNVFAGFGSLEYEVTPEFTVAGALRFDREERRVNPLVPNLPDPIDPTRSINPGYDFGSGTLVSKSRVYQQLQPKVTLRYAVTPDFSVYADYGVGFKAGGFNSQGSEAVIETFFNDPVLALGSDIGVNDEYQKEKSEAMELGFKLNALDGDLQVSGAVYRNIVNGMQFFEFFTGTFGLLRVVSNIDKVELYGAELGINYKVTPGFTINIGGNILDSEIKRNSARTNTVGNKAPYSADYTLNAGFLIEQPINDSLDFTFKADYRLTGPTWFHVVQDQQVRTVFDLIIPGAGIADYSKTQRDAYGIVNLRAGIKSDRWRLTAFANNLFKKHYLEEVIPAPEFGGSFSTPGSLRQIGVEFGFDF
ncbi:TonB-dependent receptor [Sphingorhabdus sp. SMR4y]|uniref:TonB-dependent receptor n=1 Tax=Sphingorhabdus sp. SMR4y TaxID=2584094 RepID=UPI000B5C5900|nr:TonB-dependent receptor [Sphingorhabdus sp. SMR4y]ASK88631.1 pesticin receptor [Sphingorhabdus sp. SMR4y]